MWPESSSANAVILVKKICYNSRDIEFIRDYFFGAPWILFMVISGNINLVDIIREWYEEKTYYDYKTSQCPRICAHYTQVVWAASRQVGCAIHICPGNAETLACKYLPRGNVHGEKPFKKGPACSQCGGGAGWCKRNLCNSRCSRSGKHCWCKAICRNCAEFNRRHCRCSCIDGWHGPDCSERCEDKNKKCAKWTSTFCNHHDHGSHVRRECPRMCKLCRWHPDDEANKCPPVYAPGAAKPEKLVKPAGSNDDDGSQHQQQRITLTLLSNVILLLTIVWKAALLWCNYTLNDSLWPILTARAGKKF